MPYYRIQYDGYMEDEFDCKETAIAHFFEALDASLDENSLTVEEWDGEEWNTV